MFASDLKSENWAVRDWRIPGEDGGGTKKSRFTEERVAHPLAQAQAGVPVKELRRKYGVSEATFYAWRRKYGSLTASELKRSRRLEEENRKLKRLVADPSLDKQRKASRRGAHRGDPDDQKND